HNFNWVHFYANYAPAPFFAGHGDYAAVLCMFLPFLLAFIFKPKVFKVTPNMRIIACMVLVIFAAGIVFSYARAAWLSLVAAAIVYAICMLKLKVRTLMLLLVATLAIGYASKDTIYHKLQKNKKVSSADM